MTDKELLQGAKTFWASMGYGERPIVGDSYIEKDITSQVEVIEQKLLQEGK